MTQPDDQGQADHSAAGQTDPAATSEAFRALAEAAMRCAAHMVSAMTTEAAEATHHATRAGGRLVLEFGPLPAFEAATLVLVEQEGQRHNLGCISVRQGRAQPGLTGH